MRHRRRDRPPQADLQSFVAARAGLIAHGCDLTTAKLTFWQLIADRFSIYSAKNHRLGKMVEAMPESRSFLDQTFGLSEHTNLQTEFIAGLATFLAMVYIVFVNPMILASAGMGQ